MEQLVLHLCLVPSLHQVAVVAVRHNKQPQEQTALLAVLLAVVAVHFMVLAVVAEQEHRVRVLTVVLVSHKELLVAVAVAAVLLRLAQMQPHLLQVRAVQVWHHQSLEPLSLMAVVAVVVLTEERQVWAVQVVAVLVR
jgi:hypothetical protein